MHVEILHSLTEQDKVSNMCRQYISRKACGDRFIWILLIDDWANLKWSDTHLKSVEGSNTSQWRSYHVCLYVKASTPPLQKRKMGKEKMRERMRDPDFKNNLINISIFSIISGDKTRWQIRRC